MYKQYLFDEMVYEDALTLGREQFLKKYDKDSEEFFDQVQADKIREIVKQAKKEIAEENTVMGRVKDWLIEMEEDAEHLSLNDWVAIHGISHKDIWEKLNSDSNLDQLDLGL